MAFCLILTAFFAVSCLAQFTVEPVSVVQAEGLEAVFECLYPGLTSHAWVLNGSFLSLLPSGIVATSPSVDFPTARLTIPAIPEYNNTVVQCEATIRESDVPVILLSGNGTLVIQGPLDSVLASLSDFSMNTITISISWTPPFSLNLTTAEPDIQYCVDVYNVTGGGADLLESVCDITDTSYTFSASDPDQLFNFTVTSRSNVEGSLNGTTSQPVQGYLIQDPVPIPPDDIGFNIVLNSSDQLQVGVFFPEQVLGTTPGRTSTHYVITLTDVETHEACVCPALPVRDNDMILLSLNCAHEIDAHRKFTISLTSLNSIGETVSEPTLEISTHNVQTMNAVYSESMKQLDITCSYLTGSSGGGYFVILHTDTQTIYRVIYRSGSETNTTVSITDWQFEDSAVVAVYDLLPLGDFSLPEVRPSVVQQSREIAKSNSTLSAGLPPSLPPSPLESTVSHPSNGVICLSCLFFSAALTGCVGVIHSTQLDSLTLIVLTVDSSGVRDCTVLTEGYYHVAVFGLSENDLGESAFNHTTVEVAASTHPTVITIGPVLTITTNMIIAPVAGGLTAAIFVLIGCLVAIVGTVLCRKRRIKHSALENVDNDYVDVPTPAGGPPPQTQTRDPGYENIAFLRGVPLPTATSDEPPSYDDLGPFRSPLPESPPPLPARNTHEPTEEGSFVNSLESVAKVTLSTPLHTQHGTSIAFSSAVGVEQPVSESSNHVSDDSAATAEPAYDVAKALLKNPADSDLPADETKTEHQYAEIQGTLTEEGVHYAHVNPKPKTGARVPSMDKTKVVYSEIDKKKLVPASGAGATSSQPDPSPLPSPPPPPPTAETVLSEIHPIAKSWYELGEALGVPESTLDNIETEGSDQVRLHDTIQVYFSSKYYTHTWERIAEALHEIGETEAADRIVRTRNIKGPQSTDVNPPPLPPRDCENLDTPTITIESQQIVGVQDASNSIAAESSEQATSDPLVNSPDQDYKGAVGTHFTEPHSELGATDNSLTGEHEISMSESPEQQEDTDRKISAVNHTFGGETFLNEVFYNDFNGLLGNTKRFFEQYKPQLNFEDDIVLANTSTTEHQPFNATTDRPQELPSQESHVSGATCRHLEWNPGLK